MTAAEAEIRAAWKEIDDAYRARDAKRIAKTILPEATHISAPNPPVYGRDAMEEVYAKAFIHLPNNKYFFSDTDLKEIIVEGNMCSIISEFSVTSEGKTTYGNMLTVMKRLADGKWYTLHNFAQWHNEEWMNKTLIPKE